MYKRALKGLLIWNILFLAGYVCILETGENRHRADQQKLPVYEVTLDSGVTADDISDAIGVVAETASIQRVVSYGTLYKEQEEEEAVVYTYDLCAEDYDTLLRIVEAEAGGEDEEGKILVANVVLNRVNSEEFPDTVQGVVFQRVNGVSQFSPVSNGKIWEVQVSEETYAAVERALMGEDLSEGALYFAARQYADQSRMKWFDENLTFLFKHGGHEFFL